MALDHTVYRPVPHNCRHGILLLPFTRRVDGSRRVDDKKRQRDSKFHIWGPCPSREEHQAETDRPWRTPPQPRPPRHRLRNVIQVIQVIQVIHGESVNQMNHALLL